MSDQEHRILQALISVEQRDLRSLRQAASYYNVPYSTLYFQVKGRKGRSIIRSNYQYLTSE